MMESDSEKLVWLLVATRDTATLRTVIFRQGANTISSTRVRVEAYEQVFPAEDASFHLIPEQSYKLEAWGPSERMSRSVTFSLGFGR